VLLTCPTCRSGLEVPDGTTAMVRCPACKTVFSPAAGLAPPEPEVEEEEEERPRPKKRTRGEVEIDEEEEEKARKKRKAENRDFDPIDPEEERRRKKKRKREEDATLTPEERRALAAAFGRASWGAQLIWISLALFMVSMVFVIGYWSLAAFSATDATYIVIAGIVGGLGWILAAVGVGLCLSGPPSSGHWGYGISAAAVTLVHLVLLVAIAVKGKEYSAGLDADPQGPGAHWGLVPTRMDAVTYYLTFLVYKDQEFVPKGSMNVSIIVGVFEIVRTTLILMLLACLARSAGDEELHYKCTRAAGFASFGPGFMALGMLAFVAVLIETRAGVTDFTKILFTTIVMGTYAVLNGCMLPGMMAARDVAEACDEPFQSQIPQM
jgi:LSD1 subclass zinc finger protein